MLPSRHSPGWGYALQGSGATSYFIGDALDLKAFYVRYESVVRATNRSTQP